ncbi:MAG: hypothetical protein QXT97_01950, partial [Candidatus Diapherotrites archaeon]
MLKRFLAGVFALFLFFSFVFAEESKLNPVAGAVVGSADSTNTATVRPVAVVSPSPDAKGEAVRNQVREQVSISDDSGKTILPVVPVKAVVSERERLEERKRLLANATGLKLAQQVV